MFSFSGGHFQIYYDYIQKKNLTIPVYNIKKGITLDLKKNLVIFKESNCNKQYIFIYIIMYKNRFLYTVNKQICSFR